MVEKTEQGYKLCMQVPSLLYKFIIGKKGETKKKIEKETGTRIIIPRQGELGDLGELNFLHLIIALFKMHFKVTCFKGKKYLV